MILIISAFSIFTIYNNITSIVFAKNKVDVFKEDLQQIAVYFWMIDKDFSEFLVTIDDIVTSYLAGENILETKTDQIEKTRQYIANNQQYIQGLGFDNYTEIINFLADAWKYKDQLFTLLGKDSPQNYLVILQNNNEKRPNGGFFGSFAFIQVYQARIQNIEIVDSYFPDFIGRNTSVTPPSRSQTFLPEKRVAFVAANRFGFTDIDGKNIKTLYEKIFNETYDTQKVAEIMDENTFTMLHNKHIKGVLFIQSDLLVSIIPSIKQKIRERQFVNAAIDIIRGESRSNKKEVYIDEVNTFFKENSLSITKHIVNNFSSIIQGDWIDMYLSNVSDNFNGFIQKRSLTNIYNPSTIYARDINDSYNKIDGFIDKNIEIIDATGKTVAQSKKDTIPINTLSGGKYTMIISYNLYVPNHYKEYISSLEKKYDIQLQNREKIILGLMPNIGITPEQGLRRRSRSIIYFPLYVSFPNNQEIGYRSAFFKSPFAHGLYYNMRIGANESRKTLAIDFIINKQ